jgi:hypothetical protein
VHVPVQDEKNSLIPVARTAPSGLKQKTPQQPPAGIPALHGRYRMISRKSPVAAST